jgi:hypothetical protein
MKNFGKNYFIPEIKTRFYEEPEKKILMAEMRFNDKFGG